jgi:hypothetical protein
MATYLLTWNPIQFDWEEIDELSQKVKSGESVVDSWTCGNTKRIKRGDRIFLLRQGAEPKGICASGRVVEGSSEGDNWKGDPSQFIEVEFDTLLNPETDEILPRSLLDEPQFSGVHWDTQRSGITIRDAVAAELEKYWIQFSRHNHSTADELGDEQKRVDSEGYFDADNLGDARRRVMASIVQRRGQSEFRRKLLNVYRGRCPITNCDAEAAIEAAHIIPYLGDKTNHLTNGIPLRADIHTLFDLYLLSIHPDTYEVVLSPELASSSYQEYGGEKLRSPQDKSYSPDRAALAKHYEMFLQKQKK